MKFVATQTLLVKVHILVRHLNHCCSVLSNTVDLATMEIIQQSSNIKHQIDVNDVTILDREEKWLESGVKEAVLDNMLSGLDTFKSIHTCTYAYVYAPILTFMILNAFV